MRKTNKKLVFLWHGLPSYALFCIKELENFFPNLTVVGVRPSVPYKELDNILSSEIIWLDEDSEYD